MKNSTVFFLLLTSALSLTYSQTVYGSRNFIVKIKASKFDITGKTAESKEEQARGLGKKEKLGKFNGMLFLFHKAGEYKFWMQDMNFPIDIIWIKENTIIDITENIAPAKKQNDLKIYQAATPVDKVLEVNSGTCRKLNIKKGQKIKISFPLYTNEEVRVPYGTFVKREVLNGICERVISVDRMLIKTHSKKKVVRLMGVKPLPNLYNINAENRGTDFLIKFIEGKKIVAELDLAQQDSAGRNYAFALSNTTMGKSLNLEIIKRGYAAADRTVPHFHMKEYITAEYKAKKDCRGLWVFLGCGE